MRDVHLRQVDLNLLSTLYALLEERHVTRAAKRCFLSQSAMSRSLERIRDTFGDELLIRTGRTYERTVRGEWLLRELENLLPRLEALVRGEPFDPAQSRERIRVAVTDNGSIVLLPALTQRIRPAAPDVTLEIVAWHDRSFEDVEAGKIDLALSPLAAPSPLETERLYKEDFVCLLGADHKLRSGRFTLKQYLELSHVVVTVLANRQTFVDRPLADLGLRRRVALSVPFFVPAVAAVAGSDLVLTLPRKLAKAVAGMANVRSVEPPPEIKSFQYFMVWHPRLTAEPAQVWFREQLRIVAKTI
jgi:DNA-binding transcriptional LysR family regulator